MYLLQIIESYSNAYWFQYDSEDLIEHSLFNESKRVEQINGDISFSNNEKFSIKRLLTFDEFHSWGPTFVSERLANLLREFPEDTQLLPVKVYIQGIEHNNFYLSNLLTTLPCIDMEKSNHESMFKNQPTWGTTFNSIQSFSADVLNGHHIVKDANSHYIFVSQYFKDTFESLKLKAWTFHDCTKSPYLLRNF